MYKAHETPRFWITYSEALRKYLVKRVDDKEMVHDILHDVYLKIFCYCRRFDFCCDKAGVKNLRSWVFQVCHNTMIDHQKQRARYELSNKTEILPGDNGQPVNENSSAMMLLQKLPRKYALPVYYDVVLQLKQSEIAEKMGISLPAAKSRIQRGKQMLRMKYLQN